MKNYDIIQHITGKSQFIDDLNPPAGTLYAAVFYSPIAHGHIKSVDYSKALAYKGVKRIFDYKDIPGENQIGGIVPDEPLFAEHEVHCVGQPIAVVLAETQNSAIRARKLITIEIEELYAITDPRDAVKRNSLILPPRVFITGNVEDAFKECDYILEGQCETGGQEHLYLETQGAIGIPLEGGHLKVISSTQGPTAVQRTCARVLGMPMNKIEVDVMRLGGGFGGKEDQASPWAAMAALGAFLTKRPIKLILPRHDDMVMTGKRNPYSSDYKIGLNKEGKILSYEATYYQNAGNSADLSPAVLDRTLFHAANAYFVPNVKLTGYGCKTNLPSNTAFRGFGGPQGKFVMETALLKAAEKMGVDPYVLQKKNLIKEGEEFHFGQVAEHARAELTWKKAEEKYDFEGIKKSIGEFNSANANIKKGFAIMPICFGISFTNTMMNQASSLIHIYTDGSISFSTGAVEMGQGVNAKIREIIRRVFDVDPDRIRSETTNTTRAANTSPTAASAGADLNGGAAYNACVTLLERLKKTIGEDLKADAGDIEFKDEIVYCYGKATDLTWKDIVQRAFMKRVDLSEHGHYATPHIYFDRETNKGHPFAYHVYGTSVTEVTVDCLRGTYVIDAVKVIHDFGHSLQPVIDLGQAEGAIMQGIGWMTLEELAYNNKGKLLSDLLSTYKVPDIHFAPKIMQVEFLGEPNPVGIFGSKAIGEPPLMYGIGSYFAILNAVKAFRPNVDFHISSPITPEKVLCNLYQQDGFKKPWFEVLAEEEI
ncbi:xanthine dehydrogenase molybdopterin binding subunit [soil metagenome]